MPIFIYALVSYFSSSWRGTLYFLLFLCHCYFKRYFYNVIRSSGFLISKILYIFYLTLDFPWVLCCFCVYFNDDTFLCHVCLPLACRWKRCFLASHWCFQIDIYSFCQKTTLPMRVVVLEYISVLPVVTIHRTACHTWRVILVCLILSQPNSW